MYDFIRGTLVELTAVHAVVEAAGVGYKLLVPVSMLNHRAQHGQEILLYTTLIIREQAHTIVGFVDRAERDLFEQLIAISGIGPKTALSLIGHLGLSGLEQAVASGQSAPFAKVPGVGKKTAERLLIELRGKVAPTQGIARPVGALADALQAMLNLGYPEPAAHRALHLAEQELGSQGDLSQLIASAIRLSKK